MTDSDQQPPGDGETLLEIGAVGDTPVAPTPPPPAELGQASIYNDTEVQKTLLDTGATDVASNADTQAETRRVAAPAGAVGGRRYEVRDELGRGGMGVVLRAHDRDLNREVALKISRADRNTGTVARFIEEAQVTGQLAHPNIVPVHELGREPGGRTWFTMKLVEGRSLAQILRLMRSSDEAARAEARAEFPISRLLYIFGQLLHGMAYAHDRGVIHRDLKPDNVMVGDYGEVLVMDWGLARVLNGPDAEVRRGVTTTRLNTPGSETLDGTVIGTPAYMPPEQARGERDRIDQRSDIYSLGAILYEMLTLHPPYDAHTASEVILKVATQTPIAPSKRNPEMVIAPRIEAICMQCLASQPEKRFATVRELQTALETFEEDVEQTAGEGTTFALLGKFYVVVSVASLFMLTAYLHSGDGRMSWEAALVYPGALSILMTFGFGVLIEWARFGPRWVFDASHAVLFWKDGGVNADARRGFFAAETTRRAKWVYLLPSLAALAYCFIFRTKGGLLVTTQMFGAGVLCAAAAGTVEFASYRRLGAMHEVAPQDSRDMPWRWGLTIAVLALATLYMAEAGWDFTWKSLRGDWRRGVLNVHLLAVLGGIWTLSVVSLPVREVNRMLARLLVRRIKPEQRAELAPYARIFGTNAVLFGAAGSLTWFSLHVPTLGTPGGAGAVDIAMGLTPLYAGLLWSWLLRWRGRVLNIRRPHETMIEQRYNEYRKAKNPRKEGFALYLLLWAPMVIGAIVSLIVLLRQAK